MNRVWYDEPPRVRRGQHWHTFHSESTIIPIRQRIFSRTNEGRRSTGHAAMMHNIWPSRYSICWKILGSGASAAISVTLKQIHSIVAARSYTDGWTIDSVKFIFIYTVYVSIQKCILDSWIYGWRFSCPLK